MLAFLDRHKFGVLGTVLLHFFFLLGANYVRLPQKVPEQELAIILNFQETEAPNTDEERSLEKNAKLDSESHSNRGKNEAAPNDVESGDYNAYNQESTSSSKESFEKQLADELKALEEQVVQEQRDLGFGYTQDQVNEMLNAQKNTDLNDVKQQKPRSEAAYKGNTNITYKLSNRFDTQLKVPVYMCQYGGLVVVNIAVDRNGKVVSAKVDTQSSKTMDGCLLDAAIKCAKNTKFNSNSNAAKIQLGSITYNFIQQ